MSWASAGNDQWLSKSNVQDGITTGAITAYGSGPSGKTNSQWITFAEFKAWVHTVSMTGSNQWITKVSVSNNLILLPYNFNMYYTSSSGTTFGGWSSSHTACTTYSGTGDVLTVYTSTATISVGTVLYINVGGDFQAISSTGTDWIYINGVGPVKVASGEVSQIGTCTYYIDWSYTNTVSETVGFLIKVNGGTEVSEISTDTGSWPITAGDTVEIIITQTTTGGTPVINTIDVTGASVISVTDTDLEVTTSVFTPTGDIDVNGVSEY